MQLNHPSTQADKYKRMLEIINQHSVVSSRQLTWQFKKLFIRRLVLENIVVLVFQYSGLLLTTLTVQPAPIWLASGAACAFIFMRGYSILPGIWIGSFLAYYWANSGISVACACATIFALQAFLLWRLSYQFNSPTLIFYQVGAFIKCILSTSLLTALSSWLLVFFCDAKLLYPHEMMPLWLQWWLANLNGILIFTLSVLTWDFYFPQWEVLKELNKLIIGILYGLLFLLLIYFIANSNHKLTLFLAVSLSLVILFLSKHFGWCGAITAIFSAGMMFTFAALLEFPLFSRLETLIFVQLFLLVTTIFGLVIAIRHEQSRTMVSRRFG